MPSFDHSTHLLPEAFITLQEKLQEFQHYLPYRPPDIALLHTDNKSLESYITDCVRAYDEQLAYDGRENDSKNRNELWQGFILHLAIFHHSHQHFSESYKAMTEVIEDIEHSDNRTFLELAQSYLQQIEIDAIHHASAHHPKAV